MTNFHVLLSQFFKCVIPVDKWVFKWVLGITLKYSWPIANLLMFYKFLVSQHRFCFCCPNFFCYLVLLAWTGQVLSQTGEPDWPLCILHLDLFSHLSLFLKSMLIAQLDLTFSYKGYIVLRLL